jgi:pilus assembly protein Flp/PilA
LASCKSAKARVRVALGRALPVELIQALWAFGKQPPRGLDSEVLKGGSPKMEALKNHLKRFAREESGQDIIEYALMIVLVALVVAGAVPSISGAVSQVFSKAISALGG